MYSHFIFLCSFLILRDPRECPNHHLFCASCIFRWSMNFGETNSKCPVCRTEGRYKPCAKTDSKLAIKHVKCPNTDCTWAGKLRDFKWHRRSHNDNSDDESVELPVITPRGSNSETASRSQTSMSEFPHSGVSSRQRLQHLMDTFHERLQQRRQHIEQHQREQERMRQESVQEVERLSRRLGDVSSNLVRLLDNMHEDSRRYHRYVNEVQDILPPPPHQDRRHDIAPAIGSDATRVEEILSEPMSAENPFVVPEEFRIPPRAISVNSTSSLHGHRPAIEISITPRLPRRRRNNASRTGQGRQRYTYGNNRLYENDTG